MKKSIKLLLLSLLLTVLLPFAASAKESGGITLQETGKGSGNVDVSLTLPKTRAEIITSLRFQLIVSVVDGEINTPVFVFADPADEEKAVTSALVTGPDDANDYLVDVIISLPTPIFKGAQESGEDVTVKIGQLKISPVKTAGDTVTAVSGYQVEVDVVNAVNTVSEDGEKIDSESESVPVLEYVNQGGIQTRTLRLSDTQSVELRKEAETKPPESETKPSESETKPSESETKPSESETKPSESETQPGGETKPSESETKPSESETQPGGETKPSESETKPSESETQPGGETKPPQGDTQPGGETKPPQGDTQPGGETKPPQGDTQPGGETKPSESETKPSESETQPGGETKPSESETQPGGETNPPETETKPSGTTPSGNLAVSKFAAKTTQGTKQIKLSWKKVSKADGYQIGRLNESTGKYKKIKTITKASTKSCTVEGEFGKTVTFRIRAYKLKADKKTKVYGASSTVTVTVPGFDKSAKPASAKGSSDTSGKKITFKWKKVPGASGYQVYRYDKSKKKFVNLKTVKGGEKTSCTSSKAIFDYGTSYTFKIRSYALNESGAKVYGKFSKEFTVQMPTKAVSKLTASSKAAKKVQLTWDKVSKATGYRVYRSTSKNGTYTKVAEIKSGSTVKYTDKKLKSGKTYYYKVTACVGDTSGTKAVESKGSAVKSVKVK